MLHQRLAEARLADHVSDFFGGCRQLLRELIDLTGNCLRKKPADGGKEGEDQQHDDQEGPADRQLDQAAQRLGGPPQADREQHPAKDHEVYPQGQPQKQHGEPDQRQICESTRNRHPRLQALQAHSEGSGLPLRRRGAGKRPWRFHTRHHRLARYCELPATVSADIALHPYTMYWDRLLLSFKRRPSRGVAGHEISRPRRRNNSYGRVLCSARRWPVSERRG